MVSQLESDVHRGDNSSVVIVSRTLWYQLESDVHRGDNSSVVIVNRTLWYLSSSQTSIEVTIAVWWLWAAHYGISSSQTSIEVTTAVWWLWTAHYGISARARRPSRWQQQREIGLIRVAHFLASNIAPTADLLGVHKQPLLGAKTINVFRACLGAQLTICAQKWRNSVLFSTVSFRFVLSRVCVFLYSLGPRFPIRSGCTKSILFRRM